MSTLFHHPFCPHSRFVRLALNEYGVARQLIEERRLMSWFNDKFFAEVSGPLTAERLYKRHMPLNAGGGPPETDVLHAARNNIRYHMAYIGWLARSRDWLAGG